MVFVGDIAVPDQVTLDVIGLHDVFDGKVVVANLEGDIAPGASTSEQIVFNGTSVLEYLSALNVQAVTLANNHVLDVHDSPEPTIQQLAEWGIAACGAGASLADAQQPAVVRESDVDIVLLAFGWKVIQCRIATDHTAGVNPLRPDHVIRSVRQARAEHPSARIVCLMHWNYELELYPQPLHRQLAFRVVDAGADAIIGVHSHRVQGVEVYRGAPIVYGLGNWLLAQGEYWGGSLTFPEYASLELAFEWDSRTGECTCHWFHYDAETHGLDHLTSEALAESHRVRELTPFQGMGHDEYVRWFRSQRVKRRLLPVYASCDAPVLNRLKDEWVLLRGKMIDQLIRWNVKSGARSR